MPESPAGGAAFLNGEEIVNDARTLAYLAAGYGPSNMQINGGCACPDIRELIDCDSDPYESPVADPAPWYDSSVPESADFAGFLTVEFIGLGSTYTRTPIDKVTSGSVLGRLRSGPRPMTWRGYLFGRSDCAVRYGLSWLTAHLKGASCVACNGEELDLLVCCPDLEDSPPVTGCASLPAINRPEICPPYSQPDAFRTLKNVGLVAGPRILSQRRMGCSSSCGNSACIGDETLIMEIEFTLMAGNPYLYGCPVCLCVEQPFPPISDCDDVWFKVADSNNPSGPCGVEECPPETDCSLTDSLCDPAVLPPVPVFTDNCFCDPIVPVQFCCDVPADSFGQFFEGAPVIEIYSGSGVMRSTTIRFFENPQGLPCCDTAEDPCRNCDALQIRYIPANSTLTIDGTTRSVTLDCPGLARPIRAEHLTATPFSWPILECTEFCICIETEGLAVQPDATVTVLITPREM